MTDIKEAAVAHFASQREQLESIEVPEWGGRLYFVRHPTVREYSEITKNVDEHGNLTAEASFTAFFLMTRKQDGTRLFFAQERSTIDDRIAPEVVRRLVAEMGIFAAMSGRSEAAKKPLPTPSPTT